MDPASPQAGLFTVTGWPMLEGVPHVEGTGTTPEGTACRVVRPVAEVITPPDDDQTRLEVYMQALEAAEAGTFTLASWPSFGDEVFAYVTLTDETGRVRDVAYTSCLEAVTEMPHLVGSSIQPGDGSGSIRVADIVTPGDIFLDMRESGPVGNDWILTAYEVRFSDYRPDTHQRPAFIKKEQEAGIFSCNNNVS
ncbi:iron-sulfur cluster assembly scaffold protein [Komagataeibacter europaeus]|uniref:hypothetical protein n=1 Tax=Komagataeibacter europaeus TaxID=33995 RepID=UPI0012FCE70A|nr:hypothetical protein [Komagataeibacter europaeus]